MCHSILPKGDLKLSFTKYQYLHTVCAPMGTLANPQALRIWVVWTAMYCRHNNSCAGDNQNLMYFSFLHFNMIHDS